MIIIMIGCKSVSRIAATAHSSMKSINSFAGLHVKDKQVREETSYSRKKRCLDAKMPGYRLEATLGTCA